MCWAQESRKTSRTREREYGMHGEWENQRLACTRRMGERESVSGKESERKGTRVTNRLSCSAFVYNKINVRVAREWERERQRDQNIGSMWTFAVPRAQCPPNTKNRICIFDDSGNYLLSATIERDREESISAFFSNKYEELTLNVRCRVPYDVLHAHRPCHTVTML